MHDPLQTVGSLRDHLARHDKPIAFLFGAGTSAAPRKNQTDEPLIPSVEPLTRLCQDAVRQKGTEIGNAWKLIEEESRVTDGNAFIEAILSRVRLKIQAMGLNDTLAGLTVSQLKEFEEAIRQTIAAAVQPSSSEIPEKLPHHELARWVGRSARTRAVEIFTTNYDVLLEQAFEDERLAIFDGFVGSHQPFFSPESLGRAELAPGAAWVRLWKIHGSVNWKWKEIGQSRRITRTQPTGSGELILPSSMKYDESRKQPFIALLDRLGAFLAQDDALLISCGYSFCDEHINAILFQALSNPGRTHIFALQFNDPADDSALARMACRRSSLSVLAPTFAWIGSAKGEWRLLEPITSATAGFMDIAFDTDAEPRPDKQSLTGRFRLGDFNYLSKFLVNFSASSSSDE